jgi:hypothetical protein
MLLHFGELGAVASAQMSLLLAEGKFDAAESWLAMWERADPEPQHIDYYRARLQEARPGRRQKR